jgi:hypothetical protein
MLAGHAAAAENLGGQHATTSSVEASAAVLDGASSTIC